MLYLFSFILTTFFIIFFSYLSPYLKLLDIPNKRKLHKGPVPLVGGIAIYLTVLIILPFVNFDFPLKIIVLSSGIILILGVLDDAFELGIEELFVDGISLIEWPERLGSFLPMDRLNLIFSYSTHLSGTTTTRQIKINGPRSWQSRINNAFQRQIND